MNPEEPRPALTRPDGRRITDRDLRRAMRLNITAGSLGMVWVATAMGIPLVMLLESLGATGVQIGLATTIQQLAMLAQIPASFLAERFSSRKKFWAWVALPHRLLWLAPAVLPYVVGQQPALAINLLLLAVAVSSILAQAGTASWFSWMTDLIPQKSSSRFWGRRQALVMMAYLAATALVGWALDVFPDPREPGGSYHGFALVFAIGAICGVLDILVHLGVPEPRGAPAKPNQSVWRKLIDPLREPDFRRLTLAMGAWAFSVGLIGAFGVVYLKRAFGISYFGLSAITIAASLGAILAGFQSGYVIDRLGARAYGALMVALGPALGVAWFFTSDTELDFLLPYVGAFAVSQPVCLLFVSSLAAGALYSSVGLCQFRLLSALAPSEGRTLAMAIHWTLVGMMAAAGPVLAGLVVDWCEQNPSSWQTPVGMPVDFIHALVTLHLVTAWGVCVPALLRLSLRKGDLPVGAALPRLWLGNPLRAVRNAYNIYAITAAVSARERADAVRGLGAGRAALAVSDLIAKLDDPDYEVREAAASALGQVDAPEAIEALTAKLAHPECDIVPPIARALRALADPRSVEALTRALGAGDRETQCECARALGAIRDRRAAKPLLDLLGRTNDTRVMVACVEALARLRELAAIPRLLSELRATHNRVAQRSLLVTLADLLGRRGAFYKALAREESTRGREVERLAQAIRATVGRKDPVVGELLRKFETAYEQEARDDCAAALADLGQRLAGASVDPIQLNILAYLEALKAKWGVLGQDQRDFAALLLGLQLLAALYDHSSAERD